jgi:hypothetical protein
MVLTGGGYVVLGEAGARAGRVAKDNPYHDARGWFTTADGAGGAASRRAKPREHVAQGGVPEEENRNADEPTDPLAEVRQQEWADAYKTLKQIDPKNSYLSNATPTDWVPTDQNIADLNTEIAKVATRRAIDFVMPGGQLIGTRGNGPDVRNIPGGAKAAEDAFEYMSVGGTPYAGAYPGKMVILPGNVGLVGLRNNKDGIPTVDINIPATFGSIRFHYQ